MIVVTIEKWPNGNSDERRELGRVQITNDLTGDDTSAHYDVQLLQRDGNSMRHKTRKSGRVANFPRAKYLPEANPFVILLYALRACLMPDQKPKN
ncbi:MAG: hypothetical protein ACTSY1_10035 [Alphaproteobacteria bacterium]